MFYSLLENLHMNVICLYYGYILLELENYLLGSSLYILSPVGLILNLDFILKLFLKLCYIVNYNLI